MPDDQQVLMYVTVREQVHIYSYCCNIIFTMNNFEEILKIIFALKIMNGSKENVICIIQIKILASKTILKLFKDIKILLIEDTTIVYYCPEE